MLQQLMLILHTIHLNCVLAEVVDDTGCLKMVHAEHADALWVSTKKTNALPLAIIK